MGSGFCFSVTTACNVNRLSIRYCKSTEHKLIRVSQTFPEILPAPPTIALLLSALDMGSCGVGPLRDFYVALLDKGMKPEMARLTLARKITAIALTLWKKEERFDAEQLNTQAA